MNTATPRRPVVLLTADFDTTAAQNGAHTEQEYRLRANYVDAVTDVGGLPLIVPLHADPLDELLALADGLIVTGSAPGAEVASERLAFERRLVATAIASGMPLLGICHGMQLIGECLGGRIVRDDPKLTPDITPHIPSLVPNRLAHEVELRSGSRLAAWYPARRLRVNSLHRHALADVGDGDSEGDGERVVRYRVAARANDGVVEAIEGLGPGFCLGIQWHPEYRLTDLDRCILREFVAQSAKWAKLR